MLLIYPGCALIDLGPALTERWDLYEAGKIRPGFHKARAQIDTRH
jgi:hypothetical protein